jgi:hypothetical protein
MKCEDCLLDRMNDDCGKFCKTAIDSFSPEFTGCAVKVYDHLTPCDHPGCLHHMKHPCEGCGRIGGVGRAEIRENPYIKL